MQLSILHLDGALAAQSGFLESCEAQGVRHLAAREEGEHLRLWARNRELNAFSKKLREHLKQDGNTPSLCFFGSSDFHHISALLACAVGDDSSKPITVLHFDNHPDWVVFRGGMHCGSWVHRALAHRHIAKVITIGVCSNDLDHPERKGANLKPMVEGRLEIFPYHHAPSRVSKAYGQGAGFCQIGNEIHWQTIARIGEEAFLNHLLSRIHTEGVYITIDKDVLSHEDAETNWDQGQMRLSWLLGALRAIGERHFIAGADVTGDYSRPRYSGNPVRRVLKHGEIMLDQPRRRPNHNHAVNLNGAANLALLDTFSEIMA